MQPQQKYISQFSKTLKAFGISVKQQGDCLLFTHENKELKFLLQKENLDYLEKEQQKLSALIRSKLKLNASIFARNCELKKLDKKTAEEFLNTYHLMNATQSAFNYGLFHNAELIAVASFSKGRKMNRLQEHERSFELIRFCCKEGITVTGGLTKLVKNFCREKKAGDVMTYISKQFGDGKSFTNAGFKKTGETERNIKLIFTPDEKL